METSFVDLLQLASHLAIPSEGPLQRGSCIGLHTRGYCHVPAIQPVHGNAISKCKHEGHRGIHHTPLMLRLHRVRTCPTCPPPTPSPQGPLLSRQALHAACLSLQHPLTGQRVTLSAPLHDDMATCLAALGLPVPDTRHVAQEWGGRLKGPDGGQGGCGGGRSGGRGKGKEGRRGRRGQGNGDCGRGEVEGQ